VDLADLIPLSVLELDLVAPVEGWAVFLASRGVEVVTDDIGRPAIARVDARMVIAKQREREAQARVKVAAAEQQAIEADKQWRAQLWPGVSASMMPPDVAPAAAMLQAARDAQPKRVSPLQEALTRTPGELTYHSISGASDEDES
jgi:hypothetical protein